MICQYGLGISLGITGKHFSNFVVPYKGMILASNVFTGLQLGPRRGRLQIDVEARGHVGSRCHPVGSALSSSKCFLRTTGIQDTVAGGTGDKTGEPIHFPPVSQG